MYATCPAHLFLLVFLSLWQYREKTIRYGVYALTNKLTHLALNISLPCHRFLTLALCALAFPTYTNFIICSFWILLIDLISFTNNLIQCECFTIFHSEWPANINLLRYLFVTYKWTCNSYFVMRTVSCKSPDIFITNEIIIIIVIVIIIIFSCSAARFLDHTKRRATVGRTLLDEWSARRRDLYLTTHNKHPCLRWDSNPRS
jgi:hypothetical protein